MKTISIINRKGGTGKTTSAAILQAWLFEQGYRVLAIDLDAQTNLTMNLLGANYQAPEGLATILDVLEGKRKAEQAIAATETGYIIPGDRGLVNSKPRGTGILRDALAPIKEKFDFCIIDTSPALDALTINALAASDACIIPMNTERFSIDALERVVETIDAVKEINPGLTLLGCIITRHNPRATVNKLLLEELLDTAKGKGIKVYTPYIGNYTALQEAQLFCNVFQYAPRNKGVIAYGKVYEEVLKDINKGHKRKGKNQNGK